MTPIHMDEQHEENQAVSSTLEEMNWFSDLMYQCRPKLPLSQELDISRSTRIRHPLDRWVSYSNFFLDYKLFLTNLSKDAEPTTYAQASISPNWIDVINKKIAALHECNTWDVISQPAEKNMVGNEYSRLNINWMTVWKVTKHD